MCANDILYYRAHLGLCDPSCCGCLEAKCCAVFHGPLDMPRFWKPNLGKNSVHIVSQNLWMYTQVWSFCWSYTQKMWLYHVCVCVMNTEIVLGCVCEVRYKHRNFVVLCVCVCVLLSSSLPPCRLDCSTDMHEKSGYSSATSIFLTFVFSFHISFSHVEVMQSVLWLLCFCAVFLVGDSTLQPTIYKMLISLLQMPLEEQAVNQWTHVMS